ncbi:MAG: endonuclease/exonuclease/phosphatase family protein [Gammaproteobacteria bacterium]|nr:endonuclease/exonuclease/phosphatase family protein [Gammaproteobacteria bacterium]
MHPFKATATLSLLAILAGCVSDAITAQSSPDPFRVMTFNIRYDTPDDKEDAWPHRREPVAQLIGFFDPDIIGVQEAVLHQFTDLQASLPGYTSYGVGREDGRQGGESTPIFVRNNRFEVIETGTFWLSETPEVPSVGWDAMLPRIASWLRLKDRQSTGRLLVMNTHWDHRGVKARQESGRLMREWLISNAQGNERIVLLGDFNVPPSSAAYAALIEGGHLRNTKTLSQTPPYGPAGTATRFDINRADAEPIDHIFVGAGLDVLRHAVITQHSGGRLPSDHYPVFADLRLGL